MSAPGHRDDEFQRREQELAERERALRLRELEAEILQPPYYETVKHDPAETKLQQWTRKLVRIGAFFGIVVAVIVAVRIASTLATIVIVGGIAFVIYKIVIADRTKR